MLVDYAFYSGVYMGEEADAVSFPALCARAEDVICAITRWQDPQGFTQHQMTLFKKAICAQVDCFAVNGLDSVAGGDGRGFTVGKVSISGKSGSDLVRTSAMGGHVSPLVMMYLEQSGLVDPAVPAVGGCVC